MVQRLQVELLVLEKGSEDFNFLKYFFGVGLKSNGSFRDFPYYGKIIKSKYCSWKKKKRKEASAGNSERKC